VLDTVRSQQPRFVLAAWVFLPGLFDCGACHPASAHPLSVSAVMKSVKLSSTNALGSRRRERGELCQGRFFDPAPLPMNIFVAGRRRALRTVQE
jgi:hypothetical protein